MTSHTPTTSLIRWTLAVAATVIAFFVGLYAGLFLTVLSPFPKDLAAPTAGFVMGMLIIVPGALIVRQHRIVISVALSCLGIAIAIVIRLDLLGLLIGESAALCLVVWKGRVARAGLRSPKVIMIAGFLFIGSAFFYARFKDFPAIADSVPGNLSIPFGADAARVTAFYEYDLGGFIDTQCLGRIDAPSDVASNLVSKLELIRVATVPDKFWKMPPYYWPRSFPPGAVAYQTKDFPVNERGPDGEFYFSLHDQAQNRMYIWRKSNF